MGGGGKKERLDEGIRYAIEKHAFGVHLMRVTLCDWLDTRFYCGVVGANLRKQRA